MGLPAAESASIVVVSAVHTAAGATVLVVVVVGVVVVGAMSFTSWRITSASQSSTGWYPPYEPFR